MGRPWVGGVETGCAGKFNPNAKLGMKMKTRTKIITAFLCLVINISILRVRMINHSKVHILVFLAFLALPFVSVNGAIQDEIDTKNRQIEEIQKQIDEYETQIEGARSQSQTLQNEINNLNAQINQVQLEIKSLALSISKTNLEIGATETKIGDALTLLPEIVKPYTLNSIPYKVTGNLPYYISGSLMRLLSEIEPKPVSAVFMLQREVGERIAAKPPRMNLLAAITQLWAEPRLLQTLKPSDFSPPPKVDSIIIELATRVQPLATREETVEYHLFIKKLFKQPRKTMLNNISEGTGLSKESVRAILKKEGLTGEERAQTLTLPQLLTLSRCF